MDYIVFRAHKAFVLVMLVQHADQMAQVKGWLYAEVDEYIFNSEYDP